ncbi:hypothetical protein ALC57_12999 [Trachymyrmex cornetzi]|uniref:Uncharacterized protein n=1 Tax=Trachymyrmex cornetzi TaxID=471704 RepID=A0A151J049_9HYME|nr:hypothetical protein ALC57_12999 [Trachymyrmex cornetzi]
MKEYLKYELAPFPLSLFTENGLRKNTKSDLYDEFVSIETLPVSDSIIHVIDGGFLLHKVIWQKNDTIEEIVKKYINYVRSHYAVNSYIVFDGYPEVNKTATTTLAASASTSIGTKQSERSRRNKSANVPTFEYQDISKIPFSQDKFLSNVNNKKNLIKTISDKLQSERFLCKQAPEDADVLIVILQFN